MGDFLTHNWPYGLVIVAVVGCVVVFDRLGRPGDPVDVTGRRRVSTAARERQELIDEFHTLRTGQLPHELPGGEL